MPSRAAPGKSTTEVANAGFSHIQTGKSSVARVSPDFLVVIIDINPIAWSRYDKSHSRARAKGRSQDSSAVGALQDALSAIMIFLNAHIAMQHENGLALYAAAGTGKAQLLFSTAPFSSKKPTMNTARATSTRSQPHSKPDANTYQDFKLVDDSLLQGIKDTCQSMLERSEQSAGAETDAAKYAALARSLNIGLVSALSQALCHLNRLGLSDSTDARNTNVSSVQTRAGGGTSAGQQGSASSFKSRILVLSVTEDASTQYIPMMNCIFAAQKNGISIDVCKLFGPDTVFLQQAAYLTSGTYFRLDSTHDLDSDQPDSALTSMDLRTSLVQTLLTTYLPSRSLKGSLHLPTLEEIDFRAACFCHRNIVDIGFICSVCLSLYCTPRPFCLTCKSKFPADTLERYTSELSFTAPNETLHT